MTESVELFIFVVAIYLFECAQWVPAGATSFSALLPGRWRLRRPWRASSRWSRGAAIGTPWPPLGSAMITEPLPLVLGPAGVATTDGSRFTPWEEVKRVSAVKRCIEIDGATWAHVATRRLATTITTTLGALPSLTPAARGKRLAKLLDARMRQDTLRERCAVLERDLRWLTMSTNVLWLGVFAGLPVLLWTPLAHWWLPLLGLIVLGWVLSATAFARALRRSSVMPREIWPDRMHRVLVYASPLSAVRGRDLLARELLGDLDPLCAAAVLVPRPEFAEQARFALVDLAPREDQRSGEASAQADDARWLRDALRARVERLLRSKSIDPASLLRAPEPDDEQRRAYCPRCRTQYAHGDTCANAECAGLRLVPFE